MPGRVEVIAGPMFSGKSGELIRRVERAGWAKKSTLILKPGKDTRNAAGSIAARNIIDGKSVITNSMDALVIHDAGEFMPTVRPNGTPPDVLAMDEAQFFKPWTVLAVEALLREHHDQDFRIIIAGLDLDFAREPFGPMPQFLAMADEVIKLTGVCMKCGADGARFTQRTAGSTHQYQVGNLEDYQVRCRRCHYIFDMELTQ